MYYCEQMHNNTHSLGHVSSGNANAGQRGNHGHGNNRPQSSFKHSGFRNSGGFSKGHSSNSSRGSSRGSRFAEQKIDVSRYINKNVVKVEEAPFVPVHKFADFAVVEPLKANIVKKGYVNPTPIQDQAIPVVLSGKDIVGIANTGTGKTAAFLIPLIHKVYQDKKAKVLIVVPTRELAIQIDEELRQFVQGMGIFSVICVGGSPINKQINAMKYHNSFVIGTPGRLKDLMERRTLDLSGFKTVVLDEADRMLDMGFVNDMRMMMSKMSKDRHTLFFSATLSSDIEKLIKDFLNNPVRVSVKTGVTSNNVEQDVVKVLPGQNKIDLLHDLLIQKDFGKVLIFGRTKHGVERLSKVLIGRGFTSASIHGNKSLSQRQRALADFKTGKTQILVATDVAARGLDIADVSHVINFDVPSTHEDYVHRIGRTGRGDKKGKAITFV